MLKLRTVSRYFINAVLCAVLFAACKPSVNSECDYTVTQFKLSQNNNGKWAIIDGSGSVLGFSTRYRTYDFYPYDATEAMTFSDSCKAKGLLKQYLEDKNGNSFK